MGILLRTTLTCIFIGLAVFIYLHPTTAKDYVNTRYKAFYSAFLVETQAEKYIPGSLVATATPIMLQGVIGVLALTGVLALFGFSKLFKFFAMVLVLLAAALHVPLAKLGKEEGEVAGEARKLMLIAAVFCGIIAYEGCCGCKDKGKLKGRLQEVKE